MSTEQQVKMAAKMYEMRDTAKRLLGENYAPHMVKLGALIEERAQRTGKSALSVGIEAAKQPAVSATDVIMLMAAVVELTEPAP